MASSVAIYGKRKRALIRNKLDLMIMLPEFYETNLKRELRRAGKDSGNRVLTKGTVEVEDHKYEPKPASRSRERKFGPVIERRTGKHDH